MRIFPKSLVTIGRSWVISASPVATVSFLSLVYWKLTIPVKLTWNASVTCSNHFFCSPDVSDFMIVYRATYGKIKFLSATSKMLYHSKDMIRMEPTSNDQKNSWGGRLKNSKYCIDTRNSLSSSCGLCSVFVCERWAMIPTTHSRIARSVEGHSIQLIMWRCWFSEKNIVRMWQYVSLISKAEHTLCECDGAVRWKLLNLTRKQL